MRFLAVFAAIFLTAAAARDGMAQGVVRIAAVVNEDVISAYDLANRIRMVLVTSQLQDTPENRRRLSSQVLRNMIDEYLQMQEARRLSIRVTDKEVDDLMVRLNKQNDLPPGGVEAMLARAGVDANLLRSKLRSERAWSKVIRQRLQRQVFIGDDEVEEELERLRSVQHLPRHRIAEIFLSVDDPESEQQVLDVAQRLMQQIGEGARFGALAREFSQSASAAVGGDLGWVTKGQLDPKIDQILDNMRERGVVGPVRTLAGYHILLLRERVVPSRKADENTLVDLTQIVLPLGGAPSPETVGDARQRAGEIRAQVKSCEDMRSVAQSTETTKAGDLNNIEMSRLPPAIRDAVAPLRTGQTTAPVRVAEGLFLATLCKRERAGDDGLPTAREIENRLGNQRFNLLVQRYMRDLRRTAFVDIRG